MGTAAHRRAIERGGNNPLPVILVDQAGTAGDAPIGAVEIKNATTDDRAVVRTFGDAASNAVNALLSESRLNGFNESTWDRLRTATTGAGSEGGVGILATSLSLWNAASDYRPALTASATSDAISGNNNLITALLGFNGTNLDRVRTAAGTTGILAVNTEGTKTTYSGAVLGFTPAATPTDVGTITGTATKTVRVTRVEVTGIATTAGSVPVILIKRSAADTGGTSAAVTAVPHDSNDAAATATVVNYTANPTLGTAVGNVRTERLELATTGATTASDRVVWDFTERNEKAIVLRGTAQQLAINLNGVALPAGAALDFSVTWTEE